MLVILKIQDKFKFIMRLDNKDVLDIFSSFTENIMQRGVSFRYYVITK